MRLDHHPSDQALMMPVVDHQAVNDAYLNAKTSKTPIDERAKTAAASKGVITIDISDFAGEGLVILADPEPSLAHLTTVSALEHGSRPYANHEAVAPSEDHN